MLNFIVRKIYFKKFSKKAKYTLELLKDSFRMHFIASIILFSVILLPCSFGIATLLTAIFYSNLSIDNIIAGIFFESLSLGLVIFFLITFRNEIQNLKLGMTYKLYLPYLIKGKAISKEDFEVIKEENKMLHKVITDFDASGYCYSVCFEILKVLKKGKILFAAIDSVESSDETDGKPFTMHVLYVNNDWCYDTYSQTQHPLEYALDHFYAKEYSSFSFEDIKEKDYNEFRKEHSPALKLWCEVNDCYEEWSNF